MGGQAAGGCEGVEAIVAGSTPVPVPHALARAPIDLRPYEGSHGPKLLRAREADPAPRDSTGSVEQHGVRESRVVEPSPQAPPPEHEGEIEAEPVHEGTGGADVPVLVGPDQHEFCVGDLPPQRVEGRHLGSARSAPARPEVEQHHSTPERGRGQPSPPEGGQVEVRSRFPLLLRDPAEQLGRIEQVGPPIPPDRDRGLRRGQAGRAQQPSGRGLKDVEPALRQGEAQRAEGVQASVESQGQAEIDRMVVDDDLALPDLEAPLDRRLRQVTAGQPESVTGRREGQNLVAYERA